MGPHTAAPPTTISDFPGQSDRRHGDHTPALCPLLYSGMGTGQMLIGDGIVTNLSSCGIGIRGNQSVTPGREVALFINLPGRRSHCALPRAGSPGWQDSRFGVELGSLKLEEMEAAAFPLGGSSHPR
jgi:hypothetical protein